MSVIETPAQMRDHIAILEQRRAEAEGRGDMGTATLLAGTIKRHKGILADMDTLAAEKPARAESVYPEGPVENGIEPGTPIRTVQSNGKVGGAVHVYYGDHRLACRSNGRLVESTTVMAVDEPVTCAKCQNADARYAPAAEAPTPKGKGQQTPLVEYDPIGVDPPPPIPARERAEEVPCQPPGRSVTTGELMAMMLAGRVNADLPIALSGSDVRLGAMVSLDGRLTLMPVDD